MKLPGVASPPKTCAGCRWWLRRQDWGWCGYAGNGSKIMGSDIQTENDFGCNQWEGK